MSTDAGCRRLLAVCLAAAGLFSAASAPAQPIAITTLRVTGWENLAPGAPPADPWMGRLLDTWNQGYSGLAGLSDARSGSPAGALAAEIEVGITAAGFRTRVALATSNRKLEARASIHGHQTSALLTALAGDLFFLRAQASGFELEPARPAPPLGAWLALDSLMLLPGWRTGASEPLDCAASAEGPVLLFSDRLLGLGQNLDIAAVTAGDLLLRPPYPQAFRPDRLWLDPLGRPVLFSAATGETLSYIEGLPPERRQTGLRQPVHAALLPRGGLAAVASGRVTRALRRDGVIRREQLSLPGGFYGAVEGDAEGHLWVLDLVERRIRILNGSGEEVRSLKPALDPSRQPFPQVFLPLSDGGLLLGGAGELWRFDRWGVPQWRMQSVFTGVREALPAYYRVAVAPGQTETGSGAPGPSGHTLYLLDPLGRRLFRFDDSETGGTAATPLDAASQLPALVALLQTGEASGGQLAQYALDQGLPLLAHTFLLASMPETVSVARLARLAKARLQRGLVELADRAETQLRLPEAEAALREAARLTGELRAVDPVEPSYARDLPGLVARRARLREELLEPGEQGLVAALEAAEAGRPILSLRNTSIFPAEAVSVQLRWAGFPPGAGVESMQPIRSSYTVRLPLPFPLVGYEEELTLCLSVLASWRQEGQRERRFLQAAYALPAR